jgi:hypothetical protein
LIQAAARRKVLIMVNDDVLTLNNLLCGMMQSCYYADVTPVDGWMTWKGSLNVVDGLVVCG